MAPHPTSGRKARLGRKSRHSQRPFTHGQEHAKLAAKKAKKVKRGRHPKLTGSEKRKLARLYTYTMLSTPHICEILKRFTGKTISVRCAQYNIKEVLQMNSLVSARPRTRAECRQRIAQTLAYKDTTVASRRRSQQGHSKEPTVTNSPSQLSITSSFLCEKSDGILPGCPPDQKPWNTFPSEGELSFQYFRTSRSTKPLEKSASASGFQDSEPGALEGANNASLGYPELEQILLETREHDVASPGPVSSRDVTSASLAYSLYPQYSPSSFPASLIREEYDFDQYFRDDLSTSNGVDDAWSQPAQPNHGVESGLPAGPRPSCLQSSSELDVGMTMEPPLPKPVADPNNFVQFFEPPHLPRMSVPMEVSKNPRRNTASVTPNLGISLDSYIKEQISPRPNSRSPSLGSLRKRWSYSSSQMSASLGSLRKRWSYSSSQMCEISTVFKHFSLSSKETNYSSSTISHLGSLDGISWIESHQMSLDKICTMDYPVQLPGSFLEFGPDAITSRWCDQCLVFHHSSLHYMLTPVEPSDYRKINCLDGLRVDRFNNTTLHAAAAFGADYKYLTGLIKGGGDLNVINTVGQTFLHVMDPSNLLTCEGDLPAFLSLLSRTGFDFGKLDYQGVSAFQALLQHRGFAFGQVDHHGVDVSQALHQYRLHRTITERMLEVLGTRISLMGSRDNLGRTWQSRLLYLARKAEELDPEHVKYLNESLWPSSREPCFASVGSTAFDEVPLAISYEAQDQFVDLVTRAFSEPLVEDLYGRNGLHCLAATLMERSSSSYGHEQDQLRSSRLERLLDAGVNVNSYDKAGITPLLAFVYYSQPRVGNNNNDGGTEFCLERLVKAGACVSSRNRDGESALHVAIKRGIISATQVLIKLGANLHAKDKDGKGVVKLGLEVAMKIEQDGELHKPLHRRIMTCLTLARKYGAIDDPTVVQEWDAPQTPNERHEQRSKAAVRLPECSLWIPC